MKPIILAGGFARRLWPLTLERPKALLPVAGRPIIEHVLERLEARFTEKPIISINRRFAPQFERWAASYQKDVRLVVEETHSEDEKLGAVGALAFLIEELGLREEILVLGGDNIVEFDLEEFIAAYRGRPLLALYDLGDRERVRGKYGVALADAGKILGFQEKPLEPRSTLVSIACYIYPPETFPLISKFLAQAPRGRDAPGFFNEWLLEQEVELHGFVFRGRWFDIGDRASYIEANMALSGRDLWLGRGVVIAGSTVRRSVIFDDVRIERSLIEGCVIDSGCDLHNVELRDCLIGAGTRITRG
ncbi:MAG: NDP-sugar synthase [Candidatus Acetothermia bacterium]|nr:NDP-sugar synthase [Candidatus Acetothermia bacterium]MDH7505884.1 NDP-sugar synthase [Candidatus Acetothermia bacterium]